MGGWVIRILPWCVEGVIWNHMGPPMYDPPIPPPCPCMPPPPMWVFPSIDYVEEEDEVEDKSEDESKAASHFEQKRFKKSRYGIAGFVKHRVFSRHAARRRWLKLSSGSKILRSGSVQARD